MLQTLLLASTCIITVAHAQFAAVDQEWLMDDPHKADRLPIWSHLLGNQGFGFRTHAVRNRSPVYTTRNNPSGRLTNSWMQTLQNLYRVSLLRQLLGNQNTGSHVTAVQATTPTPPHVTKIQTLSRANGQNWFNQLRNFYTMAVWSQLLRNQSGSSQNAN